MTKAAQRIWLCIVLVFAVGVIAITFPAILSTPGHIIPGTGGDGGKNMFAYLYHILYDKGYWFTGMNYPYGEHIIYMDGQPLLSVTLSYFKQITVPGALAIMWGLILLSYVLAIVYIYRILVHFGVKAFVAMLFAGLIVVMNPQLFRTQGHFGLSYVCAVPMLFYWTIQYDLNPRLKYAVYIFALGLICAFLHPYFSAIVLLWVFFYATGYFIFTKAQRPQKLKHLLPLFVSIIALLSVLGIVIKLTDPIKDRPLTPYGLSGNCTRGEHIFTSHYSPVWRFVEDHTTAIKNTSGEEGFTYLGITAIVVFIFSIMKGFVNRRRKMSEVSVVKSTGLQPVWLFIAFAFLLLGMGVPFVWHMEWLVNYLSFLRQFRTLGRFSWIFYYLVTIYAVIVLYKYHSQYLIKGKMFAAYAILVSGILLWSFEAWGYISSVRSAINGSSGNYERLLGKQGHDWPAFLEANHYKPGDFQAILVIPFSSIGSEKLWLGGEIEMSGGFEPAMQTRLPIIDAMMSRSSWGITEKQVKIAGGPYVPKPMLNDLRNNKPFLLLNYEQDKPNPDQEYLLAASDLIGTNKEWRAYACYPDRIKANDKKYADSIRAMIPYLKNSDTCLRCSGTWYVNHFDEDKAPEKFFGNGAASQIMEHETIVANIPMKPGDAHMQYEFSCWFLLGDENYRSPYFKLDMMDVKGNVISSTDILTKESTDNKGLWFRCSGFVVISDNCASIRCRLFNDPDNAYKIMDELVLRPVDAVIISGSANGEVMVNNHLLMQ